MKLVVRRILNGRVERLEVETVGDALAALETAQTGYVCSRSGQILSLLELRAMLTPNLLQEFTPDLPRAA